MRGTWKSRQFHGLSWELIPGDFQQVLRGAIALPDLIFYDMFSCRSQADEWTAAAFRNLFETCGHRPVELFTYSASTAVRAALLGAGFHVARGRSAGVKNETTIALSAAALTEASHAPPLPSPHHQHPHALLDAAWLEKWHRSHAKFPAGLAEADQPAFEQLITGHDQFQ
jgi:queuine tRNA-ribosyltransferase